MRHIFIIFCFIYYPISLIAQSQLDEEVTYSHEIIPIDLTPSENTTIYHNDIILDWSECKGISQYRLQVSTSKDFESLVLDTIVGQTDHHISHLENQHEYFWRVCALVKDHENVFTDLNFFKTTNILITGQNDADQVKLIPTHLNELEVLYIDNPNVLPYHIEIKDEHKETKFQFRCATEKMAVSLSKWPRGAYDVYLSNAQGKSKDCKVILY